MIKRPRNRFSAVKTYTRTGSKFRKKGQSEEENSTNGQRQGDKIIRSVTRWFGPPHTGRLLNQFVVRDPELPAFKSIL